MSSEPAPPPSPPHEACTVQERIAVGTAGVVYRGVQSKSGREVTFKVLSSTSTHPLEPTRILALRWRLEALQHPVIAELLDAYDDPDGFVLVTTWVAGGMGGNDFPHKTRKLTKQEARLVAMRLCGALLAGEQQNFPHGDIKPSNVVLADRGQQGLEVQIQDWGLSVCREMQPTESLQFMAPERHHGHPASTQGDLFSAAATLWFLLTGESPAYGDTTQEVLQSWGLFDAASLAKERPDLDEHFCQWLAWLLRWQPGDRPQSVAEALDVLSQVMSYAAALEAQTKSEPVAVAVADVADTPAPVAAAPAPQPAAPVAVAPVAVAPVAAKPVAAKPVAAPRAAAAPVAVVPVVPATPAKPTAARPSAPAAAKPGAPHAGTRRLKLPVASAAPPPATEAAAKTKTKARAPKPPVNKGQRAMAIVMVLCVLVGIGIAFVVWAEGHYGHDWRRQLMNHWSGKSSKKPAPTPEAPPPPPKPVETVPDDKPAAKTKKTTKPAASKSNTAKPATSTAKPAAKPGASKAPAAKPGDSKAKPADKTGDKAGAK